MMNHNGLRVPSLYLCSRLSEEPYTLIIAFNMAAQSSPPHVAAFVGFAAISAVQSGSSGIAQKLSRGGSNAL